MDALQPIINLVVFLTALSVAAERLTNVVKLGNPDLRGDQTGKALTEKQREERISKRGILIGVGVALVLKADLIAALNRLDAPWETLGWLRLHGSIVAWAPETGSLLGVVAAVIGSLVTGTALGFGSKFWHEVLDAVLELRNMAKLRNLDTRSRLPAAGAGR